MARAYHLGPSVKTKRNTKLPESEYATMVVNGLQVGKEYLRKKVERELRGLSSASRLDCGIWTGGDGDGDCRKTRLDCYLVDDFGQGSK